MEHQIVKVHDKHFEPFIPEEKIQHEVTAIHGVVLLPSKAAPKDVTPK